MRRAKQKASKSNLSVLPSFLIHLEEYINTLAKLARSIASKGKCCLCQNVKDPNNIIKMQSKIIQTLVGSMKKIEEKINALSNVVSSLLVKKLQVPPINAGFPLPKIEKEKKNTPCFTTTLNKKLELSNSQFSFAGEKSASDLRDTERRQSSNVLKKPIDGHHLFDQVRLRSALKAAVRSGSTNSKNTKSLKFTTLKNGAKSFEDLMRESKRKGFFEGRFVGSEGAKLQLAPIKKHRPTPLEDDDSIDFTELEQYYDLEELRK